MNLTNKYCNIKPWKYVYWKFLFILPFSVREIFPQVEKSQIKGEFVLKFFPEVEKFQVKGELYNTIKLEKFFISIISIPCFNT